MTRTEQAAISDTAASEVGLLMRTGPLAGDDIFVVADKQQIDAVHPNARTAWSASRSSGKTAPASIIPRDAARRHNPGASRTTTRIGVGLKPLQGLLTCGQLETTNSTSISAVTST